jgi:hypothetical protein
MPRLDNSDYGVISHYRLPYKDSDPAATPPVDLCSDCGCSWLDAYLDIEHPSYDDGEYRCFECGRILTEAEDGWTEKD